MVTHYVFSGNGNVKVTLPQKLHLRAREIHLIPEEVKNTKMHSSTSSSRGTLEWCSLETWRILEFPTNDLLVIPSWITKRIGIGSFVRLFLTMVYAF
jgi:hypothetical protein